MSMQFEITLEVLGVDRVVVENRAFVSVFVAEALSDEKKANGASGFIPRKIPADEALIPQLPAYKPHDKLKFLAVLKSAPGGKSQPHIVGVVPAKSGATA